MVNYNYNYYISKGRGAFFISSRQDHRRVRGLPVKGKNAEGAMSLSMWVLGSWSKAMKLSPSGGALSNTDVMRRVLSGLVSLLAFFNNQEDCLMKKYNVAVVGATGLVGQMMLKVLEERKFPVDQLYPMASYRSAGKTVKFNGQDYTVEELKPESFDKDIDIALFSAGGGTSTKFAPEAAKRGVIVIDNSSAWRMDPAVPLVVPEVNPEDLKKHKNIIANPNCSTIQAMVPLKPILDQYGIKRIVYSTYQAVSGAGVQGKKDLEDGVNGVAPKKFPYPIAFNILPHIDDFLENGYTKEEMKMVNETHKILHDDAIRITATTARVPVYYGHSESINVELKKPFESVEELQKCMGDFPGCILKDDPAHNVYPMPIEAEGHDEVYVGRIRRDFSVDNGFNFWCVADNIRKGAAANAVQIAESLVEQKLV